jgi:hypothetical protein
MEVGDMPNIPLYEQRSIPTTSTPVREVSGEPGAAIGRALSGIGGEIFDIATNYSEKKKELKYKADLSDYEVLKKNFETNLAQKKNDALMRGTSYSDVYNEVVVPEIVNFQETLGQRGYGKQSIGDIQNRWAFDSEDIANREIIHRERMEMNDYIFRRRAEADMLLYTDKEAANAIYDDLAGIVGEEQATQFKSKGNYDMYTVSIQKNEEMALDGMISDDQYFKNLEQLRVEIEDSDMSANDNRKLQSLVNAKISNFKHTRINDRDKAINDVYRLTKTGKLTTEDLDRLEQMAGKQYAETYYRAIEAKFTAMSMTDKDGIALVETHQRYKNGEITLERALNDIGDVKSPATSMGVYLIGVQAEEFAKGSGDFAAYDAWNKKGITVKIDSRTSDLISTINDYLNAMGDSEDGERGAFVQKAFKSYTEWRDSNPDAKDDDYTNWRRDFFKKDSENIIKRRYAPQQPEPAADLDFESMTDEELEAYINE